MSTLNEVVIGQPLGSFPGRTFNELVRGERRRRQEPSPSRAATPPSPADIALVLAALLWEAEEGVLAPGSVVVLEEPIVNPADNASVPYSGIQFRCRAATAGDDLANIPFAITKVPIAAGTIGFGVIPNATWAQVTIGDSGHTAAEIVADATLLSSSTAGRIPILWKPMSTGTQWCVVLLATSGTGGGPAMIAAFVDCDEAADAPGGVFKVANPWLWIPPDPPDPGEFDLAGTWNIISGSVTHLQLLDEDDEPVLVDVHDPLFKSPTVGDKCYIVGVAGSTEFWLVDRSCSGGGVPTP